MSDGIEPVYPGRQVETDDVGVTQEFTVDERLKPIYDALAEHGADSYRWEYLMGTSGPSLFWSEMDLRTLPSTHEEVNRFRLEPRKPTVTIGKIPMPRYAEELLLCDGSPGLQISFQSRSEAREALRLIRKAMEGK